MEVVSQMRRDILKSILKNIRGTSIIVSSKRDEITHVSRLTGGENFVSKRNQFIWYVLLNFQPVKRFKNSGNV